MSLNPELSVFLDQAARRRAGTRGTGVLACQRGQAVLEAAITVLLLFVFIFAIFEGGRLIQVQQAVTHAAREGARWSVAPLTGTSTIPSIDEVKNVVRAQLRGASLRDDIARPGVVTIDVQRFFDDRASLTLPGGEGRIYCTRVTVSYPYQIISLQMFGVMNLTLTGRATMRNETSAETSP